MPLQVLMEIVAAAVLGVLGGVALAFVGSRLFGMGCSASRAVKPPRPLSNAEREAAAIVKEATTSAKEQSVEIRSEAENEAREMRKELVNLEKRILGKEESVDKRVEALDRKANEISAKEREVEDREKGLGKEKQKVEDLIAEQVTKLEAISGMTGEQGPEGHLQPTRNGSETRHRVALETDRGRTRRDFRQEGAVGDRARPFSGSRPTMWPTPTVSVVALPSEEMKGRIIGREGRNIRALESATRHQYHHRRHAGSRYPVGLWTRYGAKWRVSRSSA